MLSTSTPTWLLVPLFSLLSDMLDVLMLLLLLLLLLLTVAGDSSKISPTCTKRLFYTVEVGKSTSGSPSSTIRSGLTAAMYRRSVCSMAFGAPKDITLLIAYPRCMSRKPINKPTAPPTPCPTTIVFRVGWSGVSYTSASNNCVAAMRN